MLKECVVCGTEFDAADKSGRAAPRRVTCSPSCQRVKKNLDDKPPKYAACVICGSGFRKMGKSVTCSKECSKARAAQTATARRHRDVASGKYAVKMREWRRKNPNAPSLVRQRERYKNDPEYREVQKKWAENNRDKRRLTSKRWYEKGGKDMQAARYAKLSAAARLVRELEEKGIEALL